MNTVAYLINTTPKYFYLLPLHFTLLERYGELEGKDIPFKVFLATEVHTHPMLSYISERFPWVTIIPLTEDQEGFLESRAAATAALPADIEYVFPIQEDFLLERTPMWTAFQDAIDILGEYTSVQSMRFMPCPGPSAKDSDFGTTQWKILSYPEDTYVFTFQATLWRREAYEKYMNLLLEEIKNTFGFPLTRQQKVEIQIRRNVAEIDFGQKLLTRQGGLHLAWPRQGVQPNAVYLSPWPYRPTAVVQGKLESWAEELSEREGLVLGLAEALGQGQGQKQSMR
jgi:hypothetical protein